MLWGYEQNVDKYSGMRKGVGTLCKGKMLGVQFSKERKK
jgi:hypothetical protein